MKLKAGEALGCSGIWIGVEGFHSPGGHGQSHYEVGVGDLEVGGVRVHVDRGLASMTAVCVTEALELGNQSLLLGEVWDYFELETFDRLQQRGYQIEFGDVEEIYR